MKRVFAYLFAVSLSTLVVTSTIAIADGAGWRCENGYDCCVATPPDTCFSDSGTCQNENNDVVDFNRRRTISHRVGHCIYRNSPTSCTEGAAGCCGTFFYFVTPSQMYCGINTRVCELVTHSGCPSPIN